MGRPINRKYFGNRSTPPTGGEGVSSVTLGANNSTGYTNGAAVTFSAPQIAGGITATGTVVVGPVGALTTKTTFTSTGTKAAANVTSLVVTPKATSGAGTGATFTVTTTGAGAAYVVGGNLTVTVAGIGTGYALNDTVTIDGALLGGVTTTNDLVLTVLTFVAAAGTITRINIVKSGGGYTSAPTPTLPTGTAGTITTTAVLTNSRQNAITVSAYTVAGGANRTGCDIIKQSGSHAYLVKSSDGTAECKLVAATPAAAGQMIMTATDSTGHTYYVTKLTGRKAWLKQYGGAGWEFADKKVVKWTFGSAVLNTSVVITNG